MAKARHEIEVNRRHLGEDEIELIIQGDSSIVISGTIILLYGRSDDGC